VFPLKLCPIDIDGHDVALGSAGREEPEEAGETFRPLAQFHATGGAVIQLHLQMVRPIRGDTDPRDDLGERAGEADRAREVGPVGDPRDGTQAAERIILAQEELQLGADRAMVPPLRVRARCGHVALDRPGDLVDGATGDDLSGHPKNEVLFDASVRRSMSLRVANRHRRP